MKQNDDQPSKFIEYLINFLNEDIDKINYHNVSTIGLEYLQLLFYSEMSAGLSTYRSKYELFTSVPLERSEQKLNETKKHLKSVQSHLITVLTDLTEKIPPVQIQQKGTRVISVLDDKFVEYFEVEEIPLDQLDTKLEKRKAEALFIDAMLNEGLIPSHFKRCENCKKFLYQQTKRKKEYCSNNCSSAARQRDYQKKIKNDQ